VFISLLTFDIALQVLDSQVLGAGSWKYQYRWTDALHVLWRAKALLQRTARDCLYTENQIIHIPCSVIKAIFGWERSLQQHSCLPLREGSQWLFCYPSLSFTVV